MHSATARAPRYLLASASVLAVFATAVAWCYAPASIAAAMVGALLLSAATIGWVLRRSAAARAALQVQIERQADRLAQVGVAQSRFVDSVAHEIKTPMTIVLNYAELVLRGNDLVAVRDHAKSLADYTLHFSDLLEGFLRLGDPLASIDTSHHVPVHVHDMVVEAVRRSQSVARSRGVTVALTIAEQGSDAVVPEVLGNEALLEAMVESLVRHAVRASWRGAQVALRVSTLGESILLHVRHHGLTIAASDLESMFDWFFQASAEVQATGNGGGLAIAKRIAEHHRGTISVRNHPEGGCEFVVTLPRHRGEAPPSSGAVAADRALPLARLA